MFAIRRILAVTSLNVMKLNGKNVDDATHGIDFADIELIEWYTTLIWTDNRWDHG